MVMSSHEIVKFLLSLIEPEVVSPVKYVIWYGSRSKQADIDLMILTVSETHWRHCSLGRLDLTCISVTQFKDLAYKLDIIATEPLFTGEVVVGEERELKELRVSISKNPPSKDTISYLFQRASEEYLSSVSLLKQYKGTSFRNYLVWAAINLGYAFSYKILSQMYDTHFWKGPFTLSKLLKVSKNSDYQFLWKTIRQSKRKPDILKEDVIIKFQRKWEEICIGNKSVGGT
jgi:hypothetical protein